jgi:hypothetical protein
LDSINFSNWIDPTPLVGDTIEGVDPKDGEENENEEDEDENVYEVWEYFHH